MKAQHHFLKIIMYVTVVILGSIGLLDLLQLLPKKENNIIDQPYVNTEPKITHDVTYDGDEQNNIDIYDQYNQAVVNISTPGTFFVTRNIMHFATFSHTRSSLLLQQNTR